MPAIKAEVSRYLADEPQPGIVECTFVDALGQSHFFMEKTAIVSGEVLSATTVYPVACELACEIEAEWSDQDGKALVRVCTELPWGIESIAGETTFIVRPAQLLHEAAV